mmetsp:Transcript_133992/g.244395  ORF Transcript_133992/g.244395 Transcript_133992/m.244395 type:complete len:367 (-) Transcript_133992:835-1935(-)
MVSNIATCISANRCPHLTSRLWCHEVELITGACGPWRWTAAELKLGDLRSGKLRCLWHCGHRVAHTLSFTHEPLLKLICPIQTLGHLWLPLQIEPLCAWLVRWHDIWSHRQLRDSTSIPRMMLNCGVRLRAGSRSFQHVGSIGQCHDSGVAGSECDIRTSVWADRTNHLRDCQHGRPTGSQGVGHAEWLCTFAGSANWHGGLRQRHHRRPIRSQRGSQTGCIQTIPHHTLRLHHHLRQCQDGWSSQWRGGAVLMSTRVRKCLWLCRCGGAMLMSTRMKNSLWLRQSLAWSWQCRCGSSRRTPSLTCWRGGGTSFETVSAYHSLRQRHHCGSNFVRSWQGCGLSLHRVCHCLWHQLWFDTLHDCQRS